MWGGTGAGKSAKFLDDQIELAVQRGIDNAINSFLPTTREPNEQEMLQILGFPDAYKYQASPSRGRGKRNIDFGGMNRNEMDMWRNL